MNQNELAERLLLIHPNIRKYYIVKYKIYEYLNISFDLFFNEDILNYKNIIHGIRDQIYETPIKYYTVVIDNNKECNTKCLHKYSLCDNLLDAQTLVNAGNIPQKYNNYKRYYQYLKLFLDSIYQKIPFNDNIKFKLNENFENIIRRWINDVYNTNFYYREISIDDDIISKKLLSESQNIRKYYMIKYKIYKLLNIPFDLFYNEDILTYPIQFYGIDYKKHNNINNIEIINNKNSINLNSYILNDNYNEHKLSKWTIDIMNNDDILTDLWLLDELTNVYLGSIYKLSPFDDNILFQLSTSFIKIKIRDYIKNI